MGVRFSTESFNGRDFTTYRIKKHMQTYSQVHGSNLWYEGYTAAHTDEMRMMKSYHQWA